MTYRQTVLAGLAVAVVSFAAAAILYDRLPVSVPVHWNIHGKADGFISKPWGAFFYPAMIGGVTLLLAVLPAISPRGFRIEPFMRTFRLIMAAVIIFSASLMVAVFAGALGLPVPVDRALLGGVGALLAVIGNVMGRTTKNFFIGVRTPWTLTNEDVWLRTNRLGGRLFVLIGLAIVVAAMVGLDPLLPLGAIIAVTVFLVVYSYVLYRKLEGRPGGSEEE